jgi:putative DNA primase/helicase
MTRRGSAVEQAQRIINENCNDAIMQMDTSDGGNADAFVEMYGGEYLFVKELGWLHWNGKYWQKDEAAVMLDMRESFDIRHDRFNRCGDDARAAQTKRQTIRLHNALEQAKSLLAMSIDRFDIDPDEINVDNGVYNLRTGELTPHDPSQLFTYCLNAPHDDTADMNVVENFMAKVLTKEGEPTNQELIDFIQTALGYSLTGYTREEKLFYLYGKLGRNGKGSITEALMELIPYPVAQEVDFNTFIAKRDGDSQNFDLADMKASRMIFASESNKYQMLNPASIKKLTGGNYVRAAHKFKEFFSYRPQYKPWLSSNHPVNGDPDDSVMWNRVLVIELPNSYQDREDKTLKELLKSPDVQKGWLRWLAIGAKRWYQDGLVTPEQVKLATRKQQEDLDTFTRWLEECTIADENGKPAASLLYQNYKNWCEAQGVAVKGNIQFSDALQNRGYERDRQAKGNVYLGLRITGEYQRMKLEEQVVYAWNSFDS